MPQIAQVKNLSNL